MQTALRIAKELLFPQRCFFCKRYGALLCADCFALLDIAPNRRPDRSKKYLADIYAPNSYGNRRVKKLIHAFKYEPFSKELGLPLARMIAAHFSLAAPDFDFNGFTVAAVPLSKKRLRWRGFNQAEIIARELGKIWQIPVTTGALIKNRHTKNQAELTKKQRLQNIKGTFVCPDRGFAANKKLFLVDDVVTTGATMEECARALMKNGARQVIGACVARTEN